MTVVTFENYTPSPRYPPVTTPWTKAQVWEASSASGPWTQIDTIVFADPDADPTKPKARNFSTPHATLEFGWYRVVFVDNVGETQQTTAPEYNGPSQLYEPTVDQVARKVLSRTRDEFGNVTGTFNDTTTPTAAQVMGIIEDVMPEVADTIGDVVPDNLVDDAAEVVSLLAAMQVELDFYPDQVNTDRSVYAQLKDRYEKALAALQLQVQSEGSDDGGAVVSTGPSLSPSYSFPEPGIGFKTRW